MIHERFLARVVDHLLDRAAAPRARLNPDCGARLLMLGLRCLTEARRLTPLHRQGRDILHTLTRQLTAATQDIKNSYYFEAPESVRELGGAVTALRDIGVPFPGRDVYLEWYRRTPFTDGPFVSTAAMAMAETITAIAVALFPASPDLHQYLQAQARSRTHSARQAAVRALASGWPDEHTRTLLTDHATTDDHEDVRQAAVRALASGWPDEHTRTLLTDHATTDNHEHVRQAAVRALATGWPDERRDERR